MGRKNEVIQIGRDGLQNFGPQSQEPYLRLDNVSKSFGPARAVDCINLEIAKGELLGLLGPSGSGKTTILNIIGGFLTPDEGRLRIAGADISRAPPHLRDIGIMFQRYALFPHLNVFDNVAFGLKQRRLSKEKIHGQVTHMLELLGLQGLDRRLPRELSGGEQQRTALARALIVKPRLMLLDEPLANLDANLRQRVRFEIREILRQSQVTSIFVTHDQEEAFSLCDRVALLRHGKIEQCGTPHDLTEQPANAFVAGFLGCANAFDASVVAYDSTQRLVRFEANGFFGHAACRESLGLGAPIKVFIRPDDINLKISHDHTRECEFTVRDSIYLGSGREIWIDGPVTLRVRVPKGGKHLANGMLVTASWDPREAHAFKGEHAR